MTEMTPERLADVARHVAQLKAEAANCPQGEGLYWTQRDVWLRDMVDHITAQEARVEALEAAGERLNGVVETMTRYLPELTGSVDSSGCVKAMNVAIATWDAAKGDK